MLIISCLYNIVDQIFVGNGVGYLGNAATGIVFPITVVGWGIEGAAIATIVGQFISFVICIAYLRKSRVFRVKPSYFVPSWRHLKPVLPLGAGSFLTQLCIVATGCLRIYLSLVTFTCLQKACAMFLQSIGPAKAAAPLSVLRDILLIVLAIVLPMGMGIIGYPVGRSCCRRDCHGYHSGGCDPCVENHGSGRPDHWPVV